MVAGLYLRVVPPSLALPGPVGELVALLVEVGPVGLAVAVVVPAVVPALVAVPHVLALVEVLVVPLLLPLHAVVCQREWRGRLLAGAVEVEVVVCHMAVPPVHLLVQVDVDVDAAGLVVGYQVESLGHRLSRGGESEPARVAIATHHVLADVVVQLNGVVGSYLEILDSELHRVVAGIDVRAAPPSLALPGPVGELLALLVEVGPVGLAVAVVVPAVVPALVAVPHVLALVEVLVVPLLLPLHAVVCQREWRGRLLAGSVVSHVFLSDSLIGVEPAIAGPLAGPEAEMEVDIASHVRCFEVTIFAPAGGCS